MSYLTRTSPRRPDRLVGSRTGPIRQPAVCLPRRNAVVALAENGAPDFTVATAIALFGFQSGAALSTVVGVLVEVPVMLSVVHLVRRSRGWYERAARPRVSTR